MLNYARQRASEALRIPRTAVLATSGPAGLQINEFPCQAVDLDLYLLVPRTSDHLFNLEQNPAVSLLTGGWALKGEAVVLLPNAPGIPADIVQRLLDLPPEACADKTEYYVLLRIAPHQMHIRKEELGQELVEQDRPGWGNPETIDLRESFSTTLPKNEWQG